MKLLQTDNMNSNVVTHQETKKYCVLFINSSEYQ